MQEIVKLGKPVVLVLIKGRPLLINWPAKNIPAIMDAWYPGMEGGNAIADCLFGDYNPAGRLSISIPRSVGQLPVYYDAKPSANRQNYIDEVATPLYTFGFGLSYSTFEYAGLNISKTHENGKLKVVIECEVKNTGNRDGDEVAQVYLRQRGASHTTPLKKLIAFERTHLKAGEKKKLRFELKDDALALYQGNNEWKTESGKYNFMVGGSSDKIALQEEIEIQNTNGAEKTLHH